MTLNLDGLIPATVLPMHADGSMPNEPVSMAASSLRKLSAFRSASGATVRASVTQG